MTSKQPIRTVGALAVALAVLAGCAGPVSPGDSRSGAGPEPPRVTKSVVMGMSGVPFTWGEMAANGNRFWNPTYTAMHDWLTMITNNGQVVPRLATEVISQERGTWRILPDGRMETTWKLRQGVTWHDGQPFTARDVVFGWQVQRDPNIPFSNPRIPRMIDRMEAPDDYTVIWYWSQIFPFANAMEAKDLEVYPAHILGPEYAKGDPTTFLGHPFWTSGFVGLGPFSMDEYVDGSHIVLRAYEKYYGGRAKVDRIEVRIYSDGNVVIAAFLGGEIDIFPSQSSLLRLEVLRTLDEAWKANGGGRLVYNHAGQFNRASVNLRNPFIGGDANVRVRHALLHAMDRPGLVDVLTFNGKIADVWEPPTARHFDIIMANAPRYPYDPQRARAIFEEAGWRGGPDGRLRNAAGQTLDLQYRGTDANQISIVGASWRAVGVNVEESVTSRAQAQDIRFAAEIPGVEGTGGGSGPTTMERNFSTKQIPSEENRFTGGNTSRYIKPAVDQLIDRFWVTIDQQEQWRIEGEIARQVLTDLPIFPLYWDSKAAPVRDRLVGIHEFDGTYTGLYETWNVTEWDVVR